MNTLNDAIMLNNEGARLLAMGNSTEALHLMQNAVHAMKDLPQSSADPSNLFATQHNTSKHPCAAREMQLKKEHHHVEIDGLLYVYNRPLIIPTNTTIVMSEDMDSFVEVVSTYLIFNFALACHQFGKISGKDVPLKRAMELYDLFIRTVSRLSANTRRNDVRQNYATLQCLVLSNLGQLYYDQCDYNDSQYCMDCMVDMIESTSCLNDTEYLTTLETEELLLNPVYLQIPTGASAA